MLTKGKIIQAIEAMPEDSFENIDVLLERLVLWNKVERGMNDIAEGNVFTDEEAKKQIDSWFQ